MPRRHLLLANIRTIHTFKASARPLPQHPSSFEIYTFYPSLKYQKRSHKDQHAGLHTRRRASLLGDHSLRNSSIQMHLNHRPMPPTGRLLFLQQERRLLFRGTVNGWMRLTSLVQLWCSRFAAGLSLLSRSRVFPFLVQ